MRRDPRAFLWDIQSAADSIASFTAGLDHGAYSESELIQAAVERKFEIIGEALAQRAKLRPDLAARVPEFREIIAFRNILLHGYAAVESVRVWRIADSALPKLRAAVADILQELGGSCKTGSAA